MFVIRIYITALTITLFIAFMMRGIGPLEALVVACPLIYMVLDMHQEMKNLKALEARVTSLSR